MKGVKLLLLSLVFLLAFAGCQDPQPQERMETDKADDRAGQSTAAPMEAETTEHDFCLKLYADSRIYRTDEAIQIWATLEYVGDEESVTIWHGDPYIVFSITDGADFHVSGFVHDILTSTVLEKGEQYQFDYVKSGGYDTLASDADFWEKFYQENDLKLPAGTYTISASGAFYLSEDLSSAEQGPSCALQITVE